MQIFKKKNFIPKGIESITYNFTKLIISNTFTDSPEWIKNEKCTINPQSNDSKCFQYSIIASLYHKEIKNNPERISKIKPLGTRRITIKNKIIKLLK